MSNFSVTVRTPNGGKQQFDEPGLSSGAVAEAVADRVGGQCGITVRPK